MKPFNIFIVLSLLIVTVGFVFFKDGFSKLQKSVSPANSSNSEILMDRLNYRDYSPNNLESALKNGRPVLFFAATIWCQTCQALEEEIKERANSLPPDVTILKVDYDNDKIMNNKYRVTSQHTLIVLDRNGNEVKRWIGGNLDALIQNLE
ncbi:thioredoxin family protein [Candidatus Daviesbacteria bacterium]|nr:thioredoxin family protein [Candidatus Daviesbacteria bacterium]